MPGKVHACRFRNCQKSYSNKYNLNRHVESVHGKKKKFRCRDCGKSLSSKQNLQEHRYIHTKAKPFACKVPFCGQTFRHGSQLSNHRKLHKELLLLNKKQMEFKELKLTDLVDGKFEDKGDALTGENKKIELPGIASEPIHGSLSVNAEDDHLKEFQGYAEYS